MSSLQQFSLTPIFQAQDLSRGLGNASDSNSLLALAYENQLSRRLREQGNQEVSPAAFVAIAQDIGMWEELIIRSALHAAGEQFAGSVENHLDNNRETSFSKLSFTGIAARSKGQ